MSEITPVDTPDPVDSSPSESIKARPFRPLAEFYAQHEEWLMARVLHYAQLHDFAKYTSTLLEAWRLSINGLNTAIRDAAESFSGIPELEADEDYAQDPASRFGLEEAREHRQRGVSVSLFLALFKYYRQAYLDLLDDEGSGWELPEGSRLFTVRQFDRFELAFVGEWNAVPVDDVIEELRSANRVMTNRKNDYLTMIESISECVIVYADDGRPRFANLAAARVFGRDQLPGTGLFGVDLDRRLDGLPTLADIRAHSRNGIYEIRRGASATYYSFKERPMLDISSKFSGDLVILNDQTESIKRSRELDQKCADLTEALEALEEAQAFLVQSEKMSSIGRLAAGVAHEINNPMGFINSNVNSLKAGAEALLTMITHYDGVKDSLPQGIQEELKAAEADLDLEFLKDDIPEMIDETLEGCRRVLRIVADMKDFSRSGQEKIEPTDIDECIESAINVAWNQIKYKAELSRDFGDAGEIFCDSSQIAQVLVNVLVNAAQAIEDFGSIAVSSRRQGAWVVITISDDGAGIADGDLGHLFDPFFTTKPVGSGTGLGLYISHQIVTKHGGDIAVRSRPGEGTVFEIRLPVAPADVSED